MSEALSEVEPGRCYNCSSWDRHVAVRGPKRSLHDGSRRRSSVFPKLVFYKGSIERDDPDDSPYLRGPGPVQNRRLSVANNRRVVNHLRGRLGSIKERPSILRDISEASGSERNHDGDLNMPGVASKVPRSEVLFSGRKRGGLVHHYRVHNRNDIDNGVVPTSASTIPMLPTIFVEDGERASSSDDSSIAELSKRPVTPGIFVDWRSDSESDDDNVDCEHRITRDRRLWSTKQRRSPREMRSLECLQNHPLAYLWDVNADIPDYNKTVKIYVSSDPTMIRERRVLITDIFPRLVTLAGSLGLRLEMVDLFLDGSPRRKLLSQLRIRDSVERSAGTSFLVLLSNDDTYAQYTTLPHIVPADIMQRLMHKPVLEILACEAAIKQLRQTSEGSPAGEYDYKQEEEFGNYEGATIAGNDESMNEDEIHILRKRIQSCNKALKSLKNYYKLDTNAVPQHFIMEEQNRNPTDDKYLIDIFLNYVKVIHYDPVVREWKNANLRSDTTSDTSLAFELSSDPRNEFLCFYRVVDKHGSTGESRKFVQMRDKIGYNNTRIYHMTSPEIERLAQGKDPKLRDSNSKYLEKFKSDATNMISNQIRRHWEKHEEESDSKSMQQITAHQLRFMQRSCQGFVGREQILREIRKYILSEWDRIPLALMGEKGCGLSSIMGIAASKAVEWRDETPSLPNSFRRKERQAIVIYRSVGVTGESNFIKDLILSICNQLREVAMILRTQSVKNHNSHPPELTSGPIQHVAEQFVSVLKEVTKFDTEVYIFIDNIISAMNHAKENNIANWIPNPLPKSVKLVLSLPVNDQLSCNDELSIAHKMDGISSSLQKMCKIVNIGKSRLNGLSGIYHRADTSNPSSLMQVFLGKASRNITKTQMKWLLEHVTNATRCLQLEMLVKTASVWNSFSEDKLMRQHLKNWTPDTAAEIMLTVLGRKHERTFYRSALCFLSCSRNGLTSREIIDLIARDKRYIGNNFGGVATHQASRTQRGAKRVMRRLALKPDLSAATERCRSTFEINAYWYQLIEDIRDLVMPCFADGTVTLKWQHAAYWQAIYAMYMSTPEDVQFYHGIMSSYFSNSPEPCRCGKTHDCHQPLYWSTHNVTPTSKTIVNRRRLSESIYHSTQCKDLEKIKFEMLFDYEWLQAKLNTTSIEFLLDEIHQVLLLKCDDLDIRLLLESLFLSYEILNNDPSQLPSQLIGRLNDIIEKDVPLAPEDPRKYPHARVLLYHIRRSKSQYLMPTTTCLIAGSQIIYDPLHGHEDEITAIACCTDGQRIATASKDSTIKIWDIIERRVIRTIRGVGDDITDLCLCMGNYHITSTHENNHINIWNIQKGVNVMSIQEYHSSEEILCTVAMDGQLLAVASKFSATVRVWDLDKMDFHKTISILPENGKCPALEMARNCHATNILIGYKNFPEAIVVNVRRGKVARSLLCESGRVTQVEVSREYYIVGCLERKMEMHEIQKYYLFDTINYGLVRALKACIEDNVTHVFVNRLGSHLIGISTNAHGAEEVILWNMETDGHRHMVQSPKKMFRGVCTDLQYCMTVAEREWAVRIHNLAAQITKHDHSRTQVRKKVDGIARLYNMPKHDKYVVAQGTGGSPITIWNVARSKCRGKAVIIERGLLDKNDIVVVKDVMVVILSDRGMVSLKHQVFETIYVYNLLLRRYERKLNPVRVTICPPNHYHLIDEDRLMATSHDRTYLTIWSIVTGEVLHEIRTSFPQYQIEEKPKRSTRRRRGNRPKTSETKVQKIKTSWKTCAVSREEQQKAIYDMIISADDSTLVCSYYARHMIVFDLRSGKHVHTLTDQNSTLQLNKAVINSNGSFLLCNNFDSVTHTSYLTLWNLSDGNVARRRQDEPKVCSVAMTDDGSRIAFVTEDKFIKIWDPFKRQSHRSIAGYQRLCVQNQEGDDSQPTTIFITMEGKRAILFANSISVWDLDGESLLMVFEPDYKFACCTVALHGQVIVIGRRDSPAITTLRLPEEENAKSHHHKSRFGEDESSDSDSSLTESEDEEL